MPATAGIPASPKRHAGEKLGTADKAAAGKTVDKTDKSKNVSHVPCKFFRQSICQAGDKCPFSHEVESESQAICKYFQKGNCKFGNKCALAHITPDGRQVNKKPSKEPRRKERHREDRKDKPVKDADAVTPKIQHAVPIRTFVPDQANLSPPSIAANQAQTHQHQSQAQTQHLPPKQLPAQTQTQTHVDPQAQPFTPAGSAPGSFNGFRSRIPSTGSSTNEHQSIELASQILTKYSRSDSQNRGYGMRSFSASLPRRNTGYSGGFMGFADGSAIVDDDEEMGGCAVEEEGEEEEEEEEEGYREQLVPSALQDLLTPLERERRNSRTSQQKKSGRVNSSPSPVQPPSFGTRRGSTNSEPNNSGSLWGPRSASTSFYRSGPFGSPPMSSSPMMGYHTPVGLNSPPISTASISFGKYPPENSILAPAAPMSPGPTHEALSGAPLTPGSKRYTAAQPPPPPANNSFMNGTYYTNGSTLVNGSTRSFPQYRVVSADKKVDIY